MKIDELRDSKVGVVEGDPPSPLDGDEGEGAENELWEAVDLLQSSACLMEFISDKRLTPRFLKRHRNKIAEVVGEIHEFVLNWEATRGF